MLASSRTEGERLAALVRLIQRLQCRGAPVDDGGPHAPAAEHLLEDAAVGGVVVHDEHGQPGEVGGAGSGRASVTAEIAA